MVVGDESEHESSLIATSKKAQGLSGRALRKLPFLAHVKHIKTPNGKCSLRQYLSHGLQSKYRLNYIAIVT